MNFFLIVCLSLQAARRKIITEPELLLDTLRSNDATGARTSLNIKKSICVLSVLIAIIELIIPTHLLCQL